MPVGNGRIFDRNILHGGALIPHRTGHDHAVVPVTVLRATDRACRANPDKGIRAAADQLFHRDRCRGAAHAGGGYRDRHAVQLADPGFVLPVVGHQLGLVKITGDQIGAERVARQQHIAPHIPFSQLDMLVFLALHDGFAPF